MDLAHTEIPRIEDEKVFERLVRDLLMVDDRYTNVNLNGSRGQAQQGVDVFARIKDQNSWIGVQCKVREKTGFKRGELKGEIDKAEKFNPKLEKYYLYTTLKRDAHTQNAVRELVDELAGKGSFEFDILFWDDIALLLREHRYFHIYLKYYSRFFTDNTMIGNFVGKLFNLELGFDDKLDTHCELMLGKIPNNGSEGTNADYYRGAYFLANLMNFKMEIIHTSKPDKPPHCFYNDIIDAIDNRIDTYRIAKWINSLKNLDEFIYDEENRYEFYISNQEREEWLSQWDED